MFIHYRCILPDNSTDEVVTLCAPYYSPGNGYFSGNEISGIHMDLLHIRDTFDDEYDLNPCVDLMLNYLCNYYFPSCNLETDEITPVCSGTCNLLLVNQDCATLSVVVNRELEQDVFSADDLCSQTYNSYDDTPPVSGNCLSIEG